MNSAIRALLVDDEQLCRENLRYALADHPGWTVAGECQDVAHARRAVANAEVDVIFLDIQMANESGMVLAHELVSRESPPIIVFTTAYQHYAVQAFELHALDYLLKPFDDERFAQAIARVENLVKLRDRAGHYGQTLKNFLQEKTVAEPVRSEAPAAAPYLDKICIRSVGRIESVDVRDIHWISSSGNYVELHQQGRTLLHRTTLTQLEERMQPHSFLRVHRRILVRREQCVSLRVVGDGVYQLMLRSGDEVPVSERFAPEVKKLLGAT